tara:strand:+ start:3682 stop:4788 length:1107 start_codon:yes stop_codon:yes gene_type:complete
MKIKYTLDKNNYEVLIKKDISSHIIKDLEKIGSDKKILIIYDEKIDGNFLKKIFQTIKINGGFVLKVKIEGDKTKKNEKTLFNIIDILINNNFSKKSLLISIGGGVIGDVSALAASLYLRGMLYFHIPSTMTAIVDSCVGGKTAINYRSITNSLGNYYHASRVYISLDLIKKLPEREFLSGIPEIIKCALISNNKKILKIFNHKKTEILNKNENLMAKICYETLKTKIFFFIDDVHEKNKRLFLNFGHTFGHAIEMATDSSKKDFFRHGEAVGLGMLCEIYYTYKKKNNLYKDLEHLLSMYNLPTNLSNFKKTNAQRLQNNIYTYIFLDKKKIDQFPRYISIKKIGKPSIKKIENDQLLNETILQIIK